MAPSGFAPYRRSAAGGAYRASPYGGSAHGAASYGEPAQFAIRGPTAELFNHGGFPLRPDAEVCSFFQKTGQCKYGFECKFDHGWASFSEGLALAQSGIPCTEDPARAFTVAGLPVRPGVGPCKYFQKNGACNYGMTCKWNHSRIAEEAVAAEGRSHAPKHADTSQEAILSELGLPLRAGVQGCRYYLKTGTCKFGASCKWDHSGEVARPEEMDSPLDPARSQDVEVNSDGLPLRPGIDPCKYFVEMGVCSYGMLCKYDHPEVAVRESVELNSDGFPIRPDKEDCAFYVQNGTCSYGPKCVKNHPEVTAADMDLMDCSFNIDGLPVRVAMAPCQVYVKTGECPKGLLCRFNHPADGPALTDSVGVDGLPLRPNALNCWAWVRNGRCPAGSSCLFNHPPREEAQRKGGKGLSKPLAASGGSVGGKGARAGGKGAAKGSGKGLGYGPSSGAGKGLSVSPGSAALNSMGYPLRPGARECNYFLKFGTCSYGATCVHHHPEVAQAGGFSMGAVHAKGAPLGLGAPSGKGSFPQRPGEPDCKYYMQRGTCSYGEKCKFNHPVFN